MTKHREPKKGSGSGIDNNTPLLIGGLATVALLAFSQKNKANATIEIDSTPSDPEMAMIADAARQFYKSFAGPSGMTLAQFRSGYQAVVAGDFSWYQIPPITSGSQEVKTGITILLSATESLIALQATPQSEPQFVKIVLSVAKRLNQSVPTSNSNTSNTNNTSNVEQGGGPTVWHNKTFAQQ